MADRDTPKKQGNAGKTRDERLKAALKANMARRKAQAKARATQDDKAVKDEG